MGTNALSDSQVRLWFSRFREGNWTTQETRGRPCSSEAATQERIEEIREAFDESRAWSLRALSEKLHVPRWTLHEVITDTLNFRQVNAKWVPYELAPSQKETRVAYSRLNLINFNQNKTRLEATVSIDETWISLNRPPEKDQLKQWLQPGEKGTTVAAFNKFGPKRMLILAMDINGICYFELLAPQEKLNGVRYLQFLESLMHRWRGNRRRAVWPLADNARRHRTSIVEAYLANNNIERWLQPPYSPDLNPCDYGCFHQLKRAINGVNYATERDLLSALNTEILEGSRNGKYEAVKKLPESWQRCINVEGEYL